MALSGIGRRWLIGFTVAPICSAALILLASALEPGVPLAGAPGVAEPQLADAPLANKALREKAGEKDGDTTYTRLVEQALDVVPRVTDGERETLRAIAHKRQARLKLAVHQHPPAAGEPASPEDDDLSTFEQELLGPERFREYRAVLTDLLEH